MNQREKIHLPDILALAEDGKYKDEYKRLMYELRKLRQEIREGYLSDERYPEHFLDMLFNYEFAAAKQGIPR